MLDERAANAVDIWHLGVPTDPDAVIDHAADVLGKVAIDRGLDGADGLVEQNRDGYFRSFIRCASRGDEHSSKSAPGNGFGDSLQRAAARNAW